MLLRQAWDAGQTTYGGWCSIPSSFSLELMGRTGFDWLCIDLQHGAVDAGDVIAMQQAAEILAVPGIDAVFVGPADLALSAGRPPTLSLDDPDQAGRIDRILDGCRAHGVVAGAFAGADAHRWRDLGFRMLAITTDARELSAGAARPPAPPPAPSPTPPTPQPPSPPPRPLSTPSR